MINELFVVSGVSILLQIRYVPVDGIVNELVTVPREVSWAAHAAEADSGRCIWKTATTINASPKTSKGNFINRFNWPNPITTKACLRVCLYC